MKENSLKSIKYAEDAKSTRKATLEAKFNKNLSNTALVRGPGTNDHHTKSLTLIWGERDIRKALAAAKDYRIFLYCYFFENIQSIHTRRSEDISFCGNFLVGSQTPLRKGN